MKFLLALVLLGVAESKPQGGGYAPLPEDKYYTQESTCNGFCVDYFKCGVDNVIKTDGEGIIQIRTGPPGAQTETTIGGNCADILQVCCKIPGEKEPVIQRPPKPVHEKCGRTRGKETVVGSGTYDIGDLDVRIHLNKDIHNFNNTAAFAAYPWMAALLKYEEVDQHGNYHEYPLNIYTCGASLIYKQVVLTAAHCVDKLNPKDLRVRLGEWDTQNPNDYPGLAHQDLEVQEIVIHPKYNPRNLWNDVAILYLKTPAELDYHIDTICLPEKDQKFNYQTCYATGWGKDFYDKKGVWQAILKEVDLPIVPRQECQIALRNTTLNCTFCLHDSFICAGGEKGKDTCEGDGGGPLVCLDEYKQQYVQAGIVAWGIGCGTITPGVYVDVARYVDWIDFMASKITGPREYPHAYQGNHFNNECRANLRNPEYSRYPDYHQCLSQVFPYTYY